LPWRPRGAAAAQRKSTRAKIAFWGGGRSFAYGIVRAALTKEKSFGGSDPMAAKEVTEAR